MLDEYLLTEDFNLMEEMENILPVVWHYQLGDRKSIWSVQNPCQHYPRNPRNLFLEDLLGTL